MEFPGASWQDRLAEAINPDAERQARAAMLVLRDAWASISLEWDAAQTAMDHVDAIDWSKADYLAQAQKFDGLAAAAVRAGERIEAAKAEAEANGWQTVLDTLYEGPSTIDIYDLQDQCERSARDARRWASARN